MTIDLVLPAVEQLIKLGVSLLIGAIIGWERETSHKPAGLRTHILVSMGSTLATVISVDYFIVDPARIAAGILTGIGFLGAGTIIAARGNVKGLTTAASLWVVAALGLAVGVGAYAIAILTAIIVLLTLLFIKVEKK